MRIKELITKLKSFWLSKKFSLSVPNVSTSLFQIRVNLLHPFVSINSYLQHSLPPPPPRPGTPQAFEPFEDEFFQIATQTQGQNCVQMFRATAGFHGLFSFFLTRGRINNRDFLVNLFFWANCYFVVLFTSMKVVLLDANDLSNNHHLSHDNDQSSLSHQRWFAAHIRPSNQYAGALTVDRCLLAVIVLGRREDNGNYLTYWLLLELHIFVFFVKLWSRKWECATQTEKRSRRGNTKKQANKYTKDTYILHPNHCVIWDKIAATERAWNARVPSFSDFQERLLKES